MTMSDKKIALAHRSLTPATPLGGGSSYKKCFRSLLEMRLNLLLKLVDRFKALPSVAVKNVPYFTRAGMMVHIPGPFAIEFPRSNSNSPPATPVPPVVHEDDEGGDEVEEPEMDDNNLPNNHNSQNLATPSHDNNNNEDEDDEEFFANLLNHQNSHHRSRSSSGGKFIVRNEFAHVRIQHLLEGIENSNYGPTSFDPRTLHQYEIGGHCVLPKELFDLCIEKGWGIPHMLAGRYHPIAGNIIPETTLLFYAPRNEEELEFIWKILFQSYQWAVVDYK